MTAREYREHADRESSRADNADRMAERCSRMQRDPSLPLPVTDAAERVKTLYRLVAEIHREAAGRLQECAASEDEHRPELGVVA